MGWFDDQEGGVAAAGPQAEGKAGDGIEQIRNWMRQFWGRTPTDAEVMGWGTGPKDGAYLAKIFEAIKGSQEARDYERTGRAGNPNAPSNPNPTPNGGGGDGSDIQASLRSGNRETVKSALADYYKQRGVEPRPTSLDYWADKIISGEGGKVDADYYINEKLPYAEEFGGGGGNYLDPWQGKYDPKDFTPPSPFEAPDPAKVLDDPAVKMQMQESTKALQRSAMAKGTLLTGNTLVELEDMAQGIASAGYDKLYNRAVAEDSSKYNRALGEYDLGRQNALARYQDSKETAYDNQDRPFSKLMQFQGLNLNALNNMNSLNASYGQNYQNALARGTDQSNGYNTSASAANAAGLVGSQNARSSAMRSTLENWGYLFGNMANRRTSAGSGRMQLHQNPYDTSYY